jgi:methyltransferase (TIGR00027 family)
VSPSIGELHGTPSLFPRPDPSDADSRLMQEVIAVRTAVLDETLLGWTSAGISQVVILASGFDTRSWRLRWPTGINVYEVDSAMIQAQKMIALGDIQPNCQSRLALIGDVFSLAKVFKSLKSVGFDSSTPARVRVEDGVEYMVPERASEMFAFIADGCAPGSQMVVTLSDCKLRELLKRYGRTVHLIEEYEAPGIVFNRILNAGWRDDGMILSGSLETRFDVDLHGCLYIAKVKK